MVTVVIHNLSRKAYNFHLIKGTELRESEISWDEWPATCFLWPFQRDTIKKINASQTE